MRLQTSSGDLLADRRADYADMLYASGDHRAAAEVMLGAVELAPGWALGWFRLGEFREAAADAIEAAEAWRTALKLDPADRAGAALKLALIGVRAQPSAPPSAFVEALFDQYAEGFDRALVGSLGYRAPQLLGDAIRAARPGSRYGLALDLGCGTGLMGVELRPIVDRLEGFDISAEMLSKARGKGVYDRLHKADLQEWALRGLPPEMHATADLVAAADVFMYVGALDRIVPAVAALLAPGGLFAFSLEKHDGAENVLLRDTRRYAHSAVYVRRMFQKGGLQPISMTSDIIRQDRGDPVDGLVVVASKR